MSDVIPVIGITTYRQSADWRGWPDVMADIVPTDYALAVERAGAVPILLPPIASDAAADAAAARIDGLIVAGGADVNPARYGEDPAPEVTVWHDHRDASELRYLAVAERLGLPVLGICRGMQLMAVAAGGALVQHLPAVVGSEAHSGGAASYSPMTVDIEAGHRISGLLPDHVQVSCHHHQSVAVAPGYTATAHCADGSLHAMELTGDRFAVGVQWHPEVGTDAGLFEGLAAAARVVAETRMVGA